jgi:hypothetical protein
MPGQAKHILTSYDVARYCVKNDVLMMSSLTNRILETAFEALSKRSGDLCDHVIADDAQIDLFEKASRPRRNGFTDPIPPVASDMREVSLKPSTICAFSCIRENGCDSKM